MKTIKIIIKKNDDGFWGYSENERAIVGVGVTFQYCKQDILYCK